jgi:hypothetical protein
MAVWQFYLDGEEIDQPQGFTDLVIGVNRQQEWHGIFFEASAIKLGFYGSAADTLRTKKDTYGIAAVAEFRAVLTCDGTADFVSGLLDFGAYSETCGTECFVSLPLESTGCVMKLRNRIDQAVDLDDPLAFDRLTNLPDYDALSMVMTLPGQDTDARVEGYSSEDDNTIPVTDQPDVTGWGVDIRPSYNNELFNSIVQGELVPASNYTELEAETTQQMSPQLLYDDNIKCFTSGLFNYTFRLKGRVWVTTDAQGLNVTANVKTWDGAEGQDIFNDGTTIHNESAYSVDDYTSGTVIEFDITFTGIIALVTGLGLYNFIQVSVFDSVNQAPDIHIIFDDETYMLVQANRSCPATTTPAGMVNEIGSRVIEAITDGCLRLNSDYYGRTDSQPISKTADGCGSLRVLASGLQIRNAENPKHFMSLNNFFRGLRGIDNIGMGIEPDPVFPNNECVRIEPVEYFYANREIFRARSIPELTLDIDSEGIFSLVEVGYDRWQVESINGLDEFNSKKTFRTTQSVTESRLQAVSQFVAGGYPIEVTRQQNFADSGGADTSYDNDTFIICVQRSAYAFEVEQGNIEDGANLYSPATALNWRIRPWYNLQRWFKSIAHCYRNMLDTGSKLLFTEGEGNLLATGQLPTYDACKIENGAYAENDPMAPTTFADSFQPIFNGETIIFTYPLTLSEYKAIKADPYGYVSAQCGNGPFVKGYIDNIQYNVFEGTAEFKLKLRWQ